MPEAVEGHLDRGNVAAARELLGEVDQEQFDALEAQCLRATERLAREHVAVVQKAEAAIAKLRSVGLDEAARELHGRLDALRTVPHERYDLRRGALAEVVADAQRELAQYREKLVFRLNRLDPTPADRARIRTLLDRGDEVTAEEFVTLLASGSELPPEEDAQRSDDFDEFFPAVVERAAAAAANAAPGQRPELEARSRRCSPPRNEASRPRASCARGWTRGGHCTSRSTSGAATTGSSAGRSRTCCGCWDWCRRATTSSTRPTHHVPGCSSTRYGPSRWTARTCRSSAPRPTAGTP
ncbi:hypothetical protein [Micromonospora sp. HM5-17]|uniref:hypothetical protein n=1 Tax=Micromonospora sp. HM5-17 TaxID=2487710 RepID=UPI000F472365|nr:hypothetical protein [Micromonospora sp. HM5-17]ROT33136.1 hypothetical protein EF879_08415 [Micromonospora sp. HM5-17]